MKKLVLAIFGVTGLILVFLLFYFIIDYPFAAAGLNRELARAKKNHIPMVKEDLNPNPPVNPSQNAAPELIEIGRKLNPVISDLDGHESPGKPLNFDQRYLGYLKAVEPYLPKILEANRKPGYRVNRDYDQFFTLKLADFIGIRAIAKALSARAKLRSDRGDINGAIEDLISNNLLGQHLGEEPFIIGQLVAISIFSINTLAIEKVATHYVNDLKSLSRLRREVVEKSHPPTNVKRALRGECYNAIALVRNLRNYQRTDDGDFLLRSDETTQRTGNPKGIVAHAYLMRILFYWNDLVESKAWKENDWLALSDESIRLEKKHFLVNSYQLSKWLASIIVPVMEGPLIAVISTEARKRTMNSLLLVLEFHAKNHRFPASLKEANADALDPFLSESLLHYKTDGMSVKVWSIGRDGKDDGGDPNKGRDVVAMYPSRKR